MGRVKRVQKTRTVQQSRWNHTTQTYDIVPVTETYWDTEYVTGSDSYGSSYSSTDSGGGYSGE